MYVYKWHARVRKTQNSVIKRNSLEVKAQINLTLIPHKCHEESENAALNRKVRIATAKNNRFLNNLNKGKGRLIGPFSLKKKKIICSNEWVPDTWEWYSENVGWKLTL